MILTMESVSKFSIENAPRKEDVLINRKVKKSMIYLFCLNPIRNLEKFTISTCHKSDTYCDDKYKIFDARLSNESGDVYYYKPVKREMNEFGEYYAIEDEYFSSKLLKIITSHRNLVETPFVYLTKSEDGEGYSGLLSKYILRGREKKKHEMYLKSRAYIYGLMVVANEADPNPKNYLMDIDENLGRIDHTSNFDNLDGFKGDPWNYEDFGNWVYPKNMFEEWKFMASQVFQRIPNGDVHQMIQQLEKDPSKVNDLHVYKILKNYDKLEKFEILKEKLTEFRKLCHAYYDSRDYDSGIDEKKESLSLELIQIFEKMTRNMLIEDSQWKIVDESNFMYFMRGIIDYLQVSDNILEMVFNVDNYNSGVKSKKTGSISPSSQDYLTDSVKKINFIASHSNTSSSGSKSNKSENVQRVKSLKKRMGKYFERSIEVFYSKLPLYNDDNLLDIDWQLFFEKGIQMQNHHVDKI